MKTNLITILIIGLVGGAFIYGVLHAVDESAKAECYGWQKDADMYALFYLTSDQKAQCDAYDITVDAVVKD